MPSGGHSDRRIGENVAKTHQRAFMENNRVKDDRPEKKEFAYTFVLILAKMASFKIPSTKDYHDKKSPQN